jgi:hypothetical protein
MLYARNGRFYLAPAHLNEDGFNQMGEPFFDVDVDGLSEAVRAALDAYREGIATDSSFDWVLSRSGCRSYGQFVSRARSASLHEASSGGYEIYLDPAEDPERVPDLDAAVRRLVQLLMPEG